MTVRVTREFLVTVEQDEIDSWGLARATEMAMDRQHRNRETPTATTTKLEPVEQLATARR